MAQRIGMRADGRLSLRKGEGDGEGLAGAGNQTLLLCPLPFCEGRGGKQTAVNSRIFGVNRTSFKLTTSVRLMEK